MKGFDVVQRSFSGYAIGLLALFCVMINTGTAQAEWQATREGPDVFGVTKVAASTFGENRGLTIQCDDKDTLFIAFLQAKKKFDEIDSRPAELLVKVDSGVPVRMPASLRTWNDNYLAVAAEGRTPEILATITAIRDAHETISIGIVIGDNKDSSFFDTEGSTNAMASVIKSCKLGTTRELSGKPPL